MKLHKHLNNEEVVEWFNIPWLTECKKKEQGQKKKKRQCYHLHALWKSLTTIL